MNRLEQLLEKGFQMEQRWPADVPIEVSERLCRKSMIDGLQEISGVELICMRKPGYHEVYKVGDRVPVGKITTVFEQIGNRNRIKCVFSK